MTPVEEPPVDFPGGDREAGQLCPAARDRGRQSHLRVAKRAAIMVGRYTHAHQFKRANRQLKFLRTRLGQLIRDINRKVAGDPTLSERFAPLRSFGCQDPLPEPAPARAEGLVSARARGRTIVKGEARALAQPQASWILLVSNPPKRGASAVDQQGAPGGRGPYHWRPLIKGYFSALRWSEVRSCLRPLRGEIDSLALMLSADPLPPSRERA